VLYHHVFRNSLLSLITVAASILPALLGGSVIVETIFGIPGMGRLGVQSVQFRDREAVLAVTLIGGVVGLLSQIIRDLLYAVADPRVSYD
jgi:ABC-type dipeptide/oligopeptide/nickel transport system permease component